MRRLMFYLVLGCILGVASAVTGVQSFSWSSRNGTVIRSVTYWHGYWRLLPLLYAALYGTMFYVVYRRLPLAWTLGWVGVIASAAAFIAGAWIGLIRQPYGWVGAIAATVGGIIVAVYWGSRWNQQRSYFIND